MIKNNKKFGGLLITVFAIFLQVANVSAQASFGSVTPPNPTSAPKTTQPDPDLSKYENINSTSLKLLICDGPAQLVHYDPVQKKYDPTYENKDFIPCDFRGLMMQIQHFINLGFIAAVLASIIGLVRVGYLYITGVPANINKSKDIFKAIGIGFAIALGAWFIVYQILVWLTDTKTYSTLFGI